MAQAGAVDTAIETRIRRLVDEARSDATNWLSELVSTPSEAPGELAGQRLVADLARSLGLIVTWHPYDDALENDDRFVPTGLPYEDRPNLVAELPGAEGQTLVCNAHIDTVASGPGWTREPYGQLVGGRFYGLGACDTKASTVAVLLAARCLMKLGEVPRTPLVLHSVVDEEPGGNGTLALVRDIEGSGQSYPWLVVVMEPTGLDLALGHRGMLHYRVTCLGHQAHGSTSAGINAIEIAADAVASLRALNARLVAWPSCPYEPPLVNVGMVRGGHESYTTPGVCRLEATARYGPGQAAGLRRALEAALNEAAPPGAVVAELVSDSAAAETPADDPAVRAAYASLAHHHVPRITRLQGTCDMNHYRDVLGVPTVVFGPGDLRHAHAADEYVDLDDVLAAARSIALLSLYGSRPTNAHDPARP